MVTGNIISLANHKGGTAKTTIAANLSHCLANKGFKVLAVDQDPQSNLSKILVAGPSFGGDVENIPRTLYDVLKKEAPITPQEAIHGTPFENLFCLPNTTASNVLEIELYSDVKKSFLFHRNHLRTWAKENYDFVIFDIPPTLSLWAQQALNASDFVIVPVEAGSQFSLDGIGPCLKLIESMASGSNPDLKFLRMLINKVDLRTSISKSAAEEIRNKFGAELVFNTTIPISTEIQKAEAALTTVIRQAPRSSASQKFRTLATEICKLVGAVELR